MTTEVPFDPLGEVRATTVLDDLIQRGELPVTRSRGNCAFTAAWLRPDDFRLVLGDGGHNPNHGGVLLPDALRWVFSSTQSAVRKVGA